MNIDLHVMYNKNLLFMLLLLGAACTKQPNTNVLHSLSESSSDNGIMKISRDSIKVVKECKFDTCLNISIPNEPNEVCLDTVFSSYKFIPLQTTEKSIIGRIEKILVCDDCFCILDRDNSNVFLFEKDGRFRCRLGEKGHGPGEHLDAWNVAYDKEDKEIVLLDLTGRKLMHYNLKGKLQRVESLFYLYTELEYQKDKMIINTGTAYNAFSDIIDLNQLVIADRNQNPKAFGYKTTEFMRREFFYASILKKCGDEIIYDDMLSDTLWCISNFEKYPLAVVNFEKSPRFSNEEKMRMTNKLFKERNKKVGQFCCWQISSNYIYMTVNTPEIGRRIFEVIYSRNSRRSKVLGNKVGESRLGDHCFSFFDGVYDNNSFIVIVEPYYLTYRLKNKQPNDVISEEERKMINTLTEDGNPVLMVSQIINF